MKVTKYERDEAIRFLREILQEGDEVWCVLRHVSSSGMLRRIDIYKIVDNQPRFLSGYASKVLGWAWDRDKGGIKVQGCGMDMGFHLVYELGHAIELKLTHRWL